MSEFIPMIISILFAFLPVYAGLGQINDRKSCKKETNGLCLDVLKCNDVGYHNVYYKVRFEYEYEGVKRRHLAVDKLSWKQAESFEEGNAYAIYVDPKKPHRVRCTNKIYSFNSVACVVIFGLLELLFLTGFMITLFTV